MKSEMANSDFPVLFVVRMVKGVRSWTVPLASSDGYYAFNIAACIIVFICSIINILNSLFP